MDLQIGLTVKVAPGDGVIRWLGENPPFASGSWVGVELFEPNGKNDGSVKGQRYFECQPNYGAFVRPSQVRVLAQPAAGAAQAKTATTGSTPAARPAIGAATPRPGHSHAKTTTTAPSTAPARPSPPRASTSRPTASTSITSPSPSRSGTPAGALGRTEDTSARRGLVRSGLSGAAARAGGLTRTTSLASALSAESGDAAPVKGPTVPPEPVASGSRPPSRPPSSAAVLAAAGSRAPSRLSVTEEIAPPAAAVAAESAASRAPPSIASAREVEELRIKQRLLEARRAEDQERIKQLELKAIEAENFAQARVKLQARFTELAQQLTEHRKEVRDLRAENEQLKSHEADVLDQLEVATIDKELAEETAEAQARQVEELQTRIEELQTQVEVYEMQGEGDDGAPLEGAASSTALIRAQTENDKLREALGKLRDRLLTTERESRQKVAELEKDLRHSEDLLTKYDTTRVKLDSAETLISDLKQQLDNALGAEEMLEQLTERTLTMGERIEEMRITIEDLEALKEMNDELEEGHVEAEKQLQKEIDSVTSKLAKEGRNIEALKAAVLDREATIAQFRELVQSQAEDIETLRRANDMQQNETADIASKSQAVMNMNLKLQNTAVKSQARLIASEVAKFELALAEEQLNIVQAYLPSAYFEIDHHATAHLLFWHRLTAKAELLVNTICQAHNLPDALQEARSEKLIGICELLGLLRRFTTLTRQFSGIVRRSTSEDYMALSKSLPDVLTLEKPFDSWIELMKRDEFQEQDCALEFQGLLAHVEHLATSVFANDQLDLCERQLGFAVAFDADLDNFAAAVGFARHACVAVSSEEDITVEVDDVSFEDGIYVPVQRILDQVRLVKVASIRLLDRMRDLQKDSASLGGEMHIALRMLSTSVSQATDVAVRLAQMVAAHVAELRERKGALVFADILAFLRQVTAGVAAGQDVQPWDIIGMFITRVANDVNDLLPKIREAQEQDLVTKLIVEPPWTARVEALKSLSAQNADAEIRASRLATQIKDLVREVKTRDQSLQEAGVKIELMERKVDTVRKQAETIVDLEGSVSKALAKEKAMQDALDHLQKELDSLESENAKLRQNGPEDRNLSSSVMRSSSMVFEAPSSGAAPSRPVMASDQVSTLKSAIRHLRAENAYLKAEGLLGDVARLPALPRFEAMPPVPALDDNLDSSDESLDGPVTPPSDRPSKHAMQTRTKLLWRELADSTLEMRIVDLTKIKPGKAWRPIKALPEVQLEETRRQREKLQRKIKRHVAATQARR